MVLFTKVEIRVLKPKEDSEEDLDIYQKNVLRDLLGSGDDDDEEDSTEDSSESEVVDAVLDIDSGVLFYEYNGVTNVEKLDDRPITLAHDLKAVVDAYKAQLKPLIETKTDN